MKPDIAIAIDSPHPIVMAPFDKLTTAETAGVSGSSDDESADDQESISDFSLSVSDDSSSYGYSSDDDDDETSLGASSMGDLEARYLSRKSATTLHDSFHKPLPKPATASTSNSNISSNLNASSNHTMQLEVEPAHLSDKDDKSMRSFMMRMNSTKSLTYFQEVDTDHDAPPMTEITRTHRRRSSQDDLALLHQDNCKQSPESFLAEMISDLTTIQLPASFWDSYFTSVSEARKQAYSMELVQAMRGQDLDTLQRLQQEQGATIMDACNAQGESLLHIACRRRNHKLVKFLLEQCQVSAKVQDDWGKTPLHELAWHSKPGKQYKEQFDSVKLLIRQAPELLFAKDKRGFTPLQYVPKDTWHHWRRFLEHHRKMIRCKVQLIAFQRSRESLQATLQKAQSTMSLMSGKRQ